MKKVLTLIVLALFTAPLVGCHGSVDVDDDDMDRDSSYKKTEVKHTDDGTKTTKTETKIDR
jgi:hypothetical protein